MKATHEAIRQLILATAEITKQVNTPGSTPTKAAQKEQDTAVRKLAILITGEDLSQNVIDDITTR